MFGDCCRDADSQRGADIRQCRRKKVALVDDVFFWAAPGEAVFKEVPDRYFNGCPDSATDQRV